MGQPGHGIHGLEHIVAGAAAAIAGHQTGQVHRQEAGAAHQIGDGKYHGAPAAQQQRVQAFIAADPQ